MTCVAGFFRPFWPVFCLLVDMLTCGDVRLFHVIIICDMILLLHCALSLTAQCIVIGPICGFVCLFVCLFVWVCYDDNSKLRASILTKLGL